MVGNRSARGTRDRVGAVWPKLLLVPLLLLGLTAMHTLGHATGSGHGSHHHAPASAASADHDAAPWSDHASDEDLPDLDPTDVCPSLSGSSTAKPWAATTVSTPWPRNPPLWTARVPAQGPPAREVRGAPSLTELQVRRV